MATPWLPTAPGTGIGGIRREENRFNQMWKNQNRNWKGSLYQILQEWRTNPYLKELTSPAYQSRSVAMAAESAKAGATAQKRESRDTASSQGLGRAFSARQEFQADQGARASTSQAAMTQGITAAAVGAEAEAQYAQTSSDIINQYNSMELQRKSEHLDSYRRYETARQERKSARRNTMIQLGALAAGAVAGGVGAFGLEGVASGAGAGLMAGGALTGMMGNAGIGYQMYAGASRMPNVYGSDPFLAYAYSRGLYGDAAAAQAAGRLQIPNAAPNYNNLSIPSPGTVAN